MKRYGFRKNPAELAIDLQRSQLATSFNNKLHENNPISFQWHVLLVKNNTTRDTPNLNPEGPHPIYNPVGDSKIKESFIVRMNLKNLSIR